MLTALQAPLDQTLVDEQPQVQIFDMNATGKAAVGDMPEITEALMRFGERLTDLERQNASSESLTRCQDQRFDSMTVQLSRL